MKELAIRNKWISLKGSSYVCDLEGNNVLQVEGKFFTVTSKKFIKTLDGQVKYIVRNKFWRLFQYKAFVCDENENIQATVKRKVFSFRDRYFIESKYGNIEVSGNIFQFNYDIKLDGVSIGHIARKISLRDSFVLTIDDSKVDYMFVVALVIAIDNITDRKDSNRSRVSFSSNN